MTAFVLLPRDGLTVKDARGFNVAGGDAARIVPWPYPSTLAGAVRTALGRAAGYDERGGDPRWRDLLATSVKGPLPIRRVAGGRWEAVYPAPADAIRFGDPKTSAVQWLQPKPPHERVRVRGTWSGTDDESRATEALWRGRVQSSEKPSRMQRWWNAGAFAQWLINPRSQIVNPDLRGPEERVDMHVGIDPRTGASKDGALFSFGTAELLTGKDEWGVWGASEAAIESGRHWTLGGEARLARVEALSADPFAVPDELIRAWKPSRFFRLVLLTPAAFRRGWRPSWLEPDGKRFVGSWNGLHLTLCAAYVGRAEAQSGWDFVRRGPKPSRRLVPAGSVFCFAAERPLEQADIRRLWLASMQEPHAGEPSQDARDGFGVVVPGQWPDAGEPS